MSFRDVMSLTTACLRDFNNVLLAMPPCPGKPSWPMSMGRRGCGRGLNRPMAAAVYNVEHATSFPDALT